MNKRKILLNPGPVTLSDRVRASLQKNDLCHRETNFAELLKEVKRKLLEVYELDSGVYDAVVLSGSGTLAVEAMLSSFISDEDKTLVLTNGVYGERMIQMMKLHNKHHDVMKESWQDPVNLIALEELLKKSSYSKLLLVHNETTTGRLNDLKAVLSICEKFNVKVLLDGVSSFGAEEINFDFPALLAVASTANKCIHGITGAAFVISKENALIQSKGNASVLYFDLFSYFSQQENGWCPFTPSVHSIYALSEALDELADQGGWENRKKSYSKISLSIRELLKKKGIETLLEWRDCSSMITSFFLPNNMTYQTLYELFEDENFIIYAGQGDLAKKIFRICNMGDIRSEDLDRLKSVIQDIF